MNLESKRTSEFETLSISHNSVDVTLQNSTEIHKHHVPKGYLILSKNDFGKVKTRVNVGYFNKKTNFIIGEEHSLMVLDKETMEVKTLNTSEILSNQSRYFLLYDLSFIKNYCNNITILDKDTNKKISIDLNHQFGEDIGEFLLKYDVNEKLPEKYRILKAVITIKNNRITLNKQLLVNSNPEFLVGILQGYVKNVGTCVVKSNINIYNFVYILNLLGAQYSIRSIENDEKHIRFKLPIILKKLTTLSDKYFRTCKYFIKDNSIDFQKGIISLAEPVEAILSDMVNSGWIELIALKDLKFLPIDDQIMFDLTMEKADAQNYFLPMTPLLKNSDGDVLGVIAFHTKDAAKECEDKFSTKLKQNFLNLSDGRVQNWGVKLDAALGLFNATV